MCSLALRTQQKESLPAVIAASGPAAAAWYRWRPPGRHAYRQEHARPRLDALLARLEDLKRSVNGGAGIAKAINYTLRRRAAFTVYLEDRCYPFDNNSVENAIRPAA